MLVTITYIVACVSFVGALVFLCVAYIRAKRDEKITREVQFKMLSEQLTSIDAKLYDIANRE